MKKLLPALLAGSLTLSAFTSTAATPPKAGSTCTKIGQTQTKGNVKFTCIKSGKKLVWDKGTPISKPTPSTSRSSSPSPTPSPTPISTPISTPTPTAAPTPSASPSTLPSPTSLPKPTPSATEVSQSAISQCKLPILDGRGDVAIGGFPRISERLKSTGKVITKVIFVDFSDYPAAMTPQDAFAKVSQSAQLFSELSYGRMQFTFDPTYKWYRMSGTAKSYAPLNQSFAHQKNFIAEAIQLAKPDLNFSNADAILVLSNPDAKDIGTSGPAFAAIYGSGFILDGKYISNGATSAFDLNYWKYIWLNHEFGHTLGLVDLYAFKPEDPSNPYDYHRFVGEFSLMGLSSLNANAPGYLAWERWLLDWLEIGRAHV